MASRHQFQSQLDLIFFVMKQWLTCYLLSLPFTNYASKLAIKIKKPSKYEVWNKAANTFSCLNSLGKFKVWKIDFCIRFTWKLIFSPWSSVQREMHQENRLIIRVNSTHGRLFLSTCWNFDKGICYFHLS